MKQYLLGLLMAFTTVGLFADQEITVCIWPPEPGITTMSNLFESRDVTCLNAILDEASIKQFVLLEGKPSIEMEINGRAFRPELRKWIEESKEKKQAWFCLLIQESPGLFSPNTKANTEFIAVNSVTNQAIYFWITARSPTNPNQLDPKEEITEIFYSSDQAVLDIAYQKVDW